MLGSFHDAEDVVQETLLRAWRGFEEFEGRSSVRHWLYRIATNACLNAIAARKSTARVLPDAERPPADEMPDREPASDIAWLEPYPDSALGGLADVTPGPDARFEIREAVHLAFVAAIQHLPPQQRAVLLLRDVMGWSAAETASLIDSSVAAVNSALQRARATLEQRFHGGRPQSHVLATDRQRELLERYVRAWENSDIDGFAALLSEDASMRMPPWPQWYRGRDAVRRFFAWTARLGGPAPFRLLSTGANGQPAFAFYSRRQSPEWRFHSIQLVTLQDEMIVDLTSFVMPELASVFGLPEKESE